MKRKYISSRRNEIVLINIKRLFYVGKKKFRSKWRTYWVEAVGIL